MRDGSRDWTSKNPLPFSPFSTSISVTLGGLGLSLGFSTILVLNLSLDDAGGGLEELVLLRVEGAMVRMLRSKRLVDLVRVEKLEVLGKLEMVLKFKTQKEEK